MTNKQQRETSSTINHKIKSALSQLDLHLQISAGPNGDILSTLNAPPPQI